MPNPQVRMRGASSDPYRPATDEPALVYRAQRGDRQAFGVLVEQYWDRLYRWLYHLSHHQHLAEDLAQETFLKAFAGLARFRAGSNFRAWLLRIAYNTFLNQCRKDAHVRPASAEEVPARDPGPDEQAMSQETLRLLSRTVGRLPPEYRAAFLLRVEEGLSFRQIAGVLDLTEETARWRVFKARQKLMEILAPQLDRENP